MNLKQKISVQISISIAVASIIVWFYFGFNLFTQTKVMVEKHDDLFNTSFKIMEDKFVWGLDLTLLITGISLLIGGLLYYVFREKKKQLEI
ncbi:MAG: hypothetical protein V1773_11965 [bacterium]